MAYCWFNLRTVTRGAIKHCHYYGNILMGKQCDNAPPYRITLEGFFSRRFQVLLFELNSLHSCTIPTGIVERPMNSNTLKQMAGADHMMPRHLHCAQIQIGLHSSHCSIKASACTLNQRVADNVA